MDLLEALSSLVFIGKDEECLRAEDGILISQAQIESVAALGKALKLRIFEEADHRELSAAGRVFAQQVEPIADELRDLTTKCRHIQMGSSDSLVIQDLPFPLLFDKKINTALYSYVQNGLLVKISLSGTDGFKTVEAVKAHHIDIGFFADPGEEDQIVQGLNQIGIGALPLRREKFILRVNREHPLAEKEKLYPLDLLDYTVITSKAESLDMLRELLTKAYTRLGLVPSFQSVDTNSYTEFYMMPLTDQVQVVDESTRKALTGAQDQVIFREFDDEDFVFTRYLIYDNTIDNQIVNMFIQAVAESQEE